MYECEVAAYGGQSAGKASVASQLKASIKKLEAGRVK
jgi:hypothetical protein